MFTVDGSSDERLLLTMYPAEPLIVKNKINRSFSLLVND